MISTIETKSRIRTFGWVQNPGEFRKLCNVVAVFDCNSEKHREVAEILIPKFVIKEDGLDNLLEAMSKRPLDIKYSHLVGVRKSRCNSIIQAAVKGIGKKEFTDDWSANGFIRWAHCLGFIAYDYTDDTFSITESGLKLTSAYSGNRELSDTERTIITEAMLSYPPAIRILSLLAPEDSHLTKFELGRQLGFIGEGGFTSMPQSTFIRTLSQIDDAKEKNKMKADWEGSSDKYARMISRWLANLGLVQQDKKTVIVTVGGTEYSESIGQSFMITAQGITALNCALGKSRHARISKNVCYEMLATKGTDREYLRSRRAYTLKIISETKKPINISDVSAFLAEKNINATMAVIRDDIKGFGNIGLDVHIDGDIIVWKDKLNDFVIPVRAEITQSSIEESKDELRSEITNIPHDYLSLLDLAYDKDQNRLFEMKTLELLTDVCGYQGLHLGGSRKPDGVIYTDELPENYGVIIDTKSYSKGYGLPITEADKMRRYVEENQRRDVAENSNKWWENFSGDVQQFYFMFVSGHFTGKYQEQIDRVTRITDTRGAAVAVRDLLLIMDGVVSGSRTLGGVEGEWFVKQ
jgi:hypothetical protein